MSDQKLYNSLGGGVSRGVVMGISLPKESGPGL